ncbi:MAG: hypothetical protein R3C11_26490 [Planctomycetaceae bacterium]
MDSRSWLEQFTSAHNSGSSHGETRVIRQAYFEHPDYVPLLLRAYELFGELEQISEKKLFERCGLLSAGPVGEDYSERSLLRNGISLHWNRFPMQKRKRDLAVSVFRYW